MGTGVQRKEAKVNCAFCDNPDFRRGTKTLTFEREGQTVVLFDVPADICTKCGEGEVDEETAERILELVEEALASGKRQIQYARAA